MFKECLFPTLNVPNVDYRDFTQITRNEADMQIHPDDVDDDPDATVANNKQPPVQESAVGDDEQQPPVPPEDAQDQGPVIDLVVPDPRKEPLPSSTASNQDHLSQLSSPMVPRQMQTPRPTVRQSPIKKGYPKGPPPSPYPKPRSETANPGTYFWHSY